jgi:hypothetical protein
MLGGEAARASEPKPLHFAVLVVINHGLMNEISLGNLKMPAKKQPVTKSSSKKNLAKKPHDALDAKVRLEGKLEENGISVTARSRTIAALDRLVGGLIGWLAEYPEGKRREVQARAEGREALLRAQDSAALRMFPEQDGIGRARLENFLRNEYRKQDNHFAVASYAIDDLLNTPPSSPKTSDTEEAPSGGESPSLDEDWMNLFSDFAARASSDRLREQWGRILAGEIRKPGTFSFLTLRVVAEMTADLARSFQEVYRLSIENFIVQPSDFSGQVLEDYGNLEAIGLLQSGLQRSIKAQPNGFAFIAGEHFGLQMTVNPGTEELSFSIVRITPAGMEIGTMLPRDEGEGVVRIGASIRGAKKIEIISVERRGEKVFIKEILRELDQESS